MLKHCKLHTRLLGSFIIVALLCAVVGYRGLCSMAAIDHSSQESSTVRMPALAALSQLNDGLMGVQVADQLGLLARVTHDGPLYRRSMSEAQTAMKEAEDASKLYQPLPKTEEETRLWHTLQAEWEAWKHTHSQVTDLQARGRWQQAQQIGLGRGLAAYHAVDDRVGQLSNLQINMAKSNQQQADHAYISAERLMYSTMLLIMGVAIGLGVLLTRNISGPVQRLAATADRLALGDVEVEVDDARQDELGQLAHAFRRMVESIRAQAQMTERIAAGDLSQRVAPRSERDLLAQSLARMVETLQGLNEEAQRLSRAAIAGELTTRGEAQRFQGGYREIIGGINATLDAVVGPLVEASGTLDRVAAQDLTARMTGSYQGGFAKIQQALNQAVEHLDDSLQQVVQAAEQVAGAAVQISGGSQTLSQGASQQASSLEEVSSSLQEMASMTRQNTANAHEAQSLSAQARQAATDGQEAMSRLTAAMERIQQSSGQTAKIVKTIDEIAFQTNLLALNAAVEAARAGDAGKGFAVVAEEVRNLAMRSAEAAKSTAAMIEEAVRDTQGGVALNAEVRGHLEAIAQQSNRVSEVMGEITAASDQQRQGVEQVTQAVGELEGLTQQNAATAEEAASAAEELSSQAEEMQSMVASFELSGSPPASGSPAATPHAPSETRPTFRLSRVRPSARSLPLHGPSVRNGVCRTAEAHIPLDPGEEFAGP